MAELADAFTRQSAIRYVCTIHEQAAIFSAEGYAKASGKPGLVIVTSGPGVGNIVTGLQNCFYDSVPLIAITGQVSSQVMRTFNSKLRQRGFQETPTYAITEPITKWSCIVGTAEIAKLAVAQAVRECQTDRHGPVLLDIPVDVQRAEMP